MPIKDINDMLNLTISNQKRKRFSERIKETNPKYSSMTEVVPPLNRGDFLNKWKEDRAQLEKIRADRDKIKEERDKYKKIINSRWSKDWSKPNDL
tara:strand:- start:417 stop:701 length:285 start_codon:yes stop_codon:yes gene_type:complete